MEQTHTYEKARELSRQYRDVWKLQLFEVQGNEKDCETESQWNLLAIARKRALELACEGPQGAGYAEIVPRNQTPCLRVNPSAIVHCKVRTRDADTCFETAVLRTTHKGRLYVFENGDMSYCHSG